MPACFVKPREKHVVVDKNKKYGRRGQLRATLSQIRTIEFRSPRSDVFGDSPKNLCWRLDDRQFLPLLTKQKPAVAVSKHRRRKLLPITNVE
jgi:hypothetical protein